MNAKGYISFTSPVDLFVANKHTTIKVMLGIKCPGINKRKTKVVRGLLWLVRASKLYFSDIETSQSALS